MMTGEIYGARAVKRRRAAGAEMEERAEFLIGYAEEHGPITVRGLYYQAEVASVPGIEKDQRGYKKVQRQVLALRREGRLSYSDIADATRWMRKPQTYTGPAAALEETARFYRKSLWTEADVYIEIWSEKDAVLGTILPITQLYDVPLMVCRGDSSETFCFEAIESREDDRRPYHVYYIGDFDRAGQSGAQTLHEKLDRFAAKKRIAVVFEQLGVTEEQIHKLKLPTREPKRVTAADIKWPHDFACELDAVPPTELRALVKAAIERHLPIEQFTALKIAEASEREIMLRWAQQVAA
jgi:hypothetical protein